MSVNRNAIYTPMLIVFQTKRLLFRPLGSQGFIYTFWRGEDGRSVRG